MFKVWVYEGFRKGSELHDTDQKQFEYYKQLRQR
jgi:hypothetical protein